MIYAETTSVSVEKTRLELETVLKKYGADAFGYMADNGRAAVTFRAHGKFVRFILPLPSPDERRFTHCSPPRSYMERTAASAQKEWEQACRSAWRALFLAVKAKLVAVQTKISSFEQEFLANIVLPNQRTVGEETIGLLEDAYKTGKMPTFSLALPQHSES